MVDSPPQLVKRGLQKSEAEALYETLQAAGASVEVREAGTGSAS
jgi:ribosomal protein L7/L12